VAEAQVPLDRPRQKMYHPLGMGAGIGNRRNKALFGPDARTPSSRRTPGGR
jgi:hypothetical protein